MPFEGFIRVDKVQGHADSTSCTWTTLLLRFKLPSATRRSFADSLDQDQAALILDP